MTEQEEQRQLERGKELLLEIGREWMASDPDEDWFDEMKHSYTRLVKASCHLGEELEWFNPDTPD